MAKLLKIVLAVLLMCLTVICSAKGAVIVKTDGTSIGCTIDGDQQLRIKTPSREFTVKLNEIFWIVGRDMRRIRLLGEGESLKGEIAKEDIKIQRSGEGSLISTEDIVFLYNKDITAPDDIHTEELGSINIIEYDEYDGGAIIKGGCKVAAFDKTEHRRGLRVSVLVNNWEGGIKIARPVYPGKITSGSSLTITFDIQGDDDLYANLSRKANDLYALVYYRSFQDQEEATVGRGQLATLSKMVELLPASRDIVKSISVELPPVAFRDVHGSGEFYLCIVKLSYFDVIKSMEDRTPGPSEEEIFGSDKRDFVAVKRTVSNILKLPLTVEEN